MRFCYLLLTLVVYSFDISYGQQINWQNKDPDKDSVMGISLERAYGLLERKGPKKVIVAIVDSGVDTAHEDLRQILWSNPADGTHGANFINDEDGMEDVTHLAIHQKNFYDSISYYKVPARYQEGYKVYRKADLSYNEHVDNMREMKRGLEACKIVLTQILEKLGKKDPIPDDFLKYNAKDDNERLVVKWIMAVFPFYRSFAELKYCEIDHLLYLVDRHLENGLNTHVSDSGTAKMYTINTDVSPDAVGILFQKNYTPYHGTHVAGIIGAVRNNGVGTDGIADNVQLMMLKVISNIRELRDKNLAYAIYYAVDHGAKIINLSFGKPYTWDKLSVDEAVRYAMKKDVLIIHAAGNEGLNLDEVPHFPTPVYLNNEIAAGWIEVGASGAKNDITLAASFSNYGQRSVDVFAPGVEIYSSIPGNRYASYSGTSMAAPVVSGVAALIREYYPKLTAVQVKGIIMQSVVKRDILKDKCVSGGVVNAYNALKLAASY